LVNSGTSVYGNSKERQRQRGTAAHNTVRLDSADSSEVWAGFRVARRARVRDVSCDGVSLSGVHDGYTRLPGMPLHHRKWTAIAEGVEVVDEVTGKREHAVELFFHFHPDWRLNLKSNVVCEVHHLHEAHSLKMNLDPGLTWRIEPSTWHPQFGIVTSNFKLVGSYHGELPLTSVTRINWPCES
jgi:uncharacterized heparinase superfamily protein